MTVPLIGRQARALVARDVDAIGTAVERLEIPYPVVADSELQIWDLYGNKGWPARYLWDQRGALYSLHYGEGAYDETEREIQRLLGVERDPAYHADRLHQLRVEHAGGQFVNRRRHRCRHWRPAAAHVTQVAYRRSKLAGRGRAFEVDCIADPQAGIDRAQIHEDTRRVVL